MEPIPWTYCHVTSCRYAMQSKEKAIPKKPLNSDENWRFFGRPNRGTDCGTHWAYWSSIHLLCKVSMSVWFQVWEVWVWNITTTCLCRKVARSYQAAHGGKDPLSQARWYPGSSTNPEADNSYHSTTGKITSRAKFPPAFPKSQSSFTAAPTVAISPKFAISAVQSPACWRLAEFQELILTEFGEK